MAAYDARWNEIKQGFDEAYKKAIAGKEPEDIVLARRVRLEGSLRAYIDFRNKSLGSLLNMLRETNPSFTEEGQADKWKTEVSKIGQQGFKMIADLDDNEESILNVFILGVATFEGDFFAKIASMPLAATQGFLCAASKTLEEEQGKLLGKWEDTEDDTKDLNEDSQEAAEQALVAFEGAVNELGRESRRLADTVKNVLIALKKLGDATSGNEPGVPDLFEYLIEKLSQTVSTAEDVANLYRDAYKSKQTALILFGNNRAAVREFLEKTNLEEALEKTRTSREAALRIAQSTITDGQQDDAEDFAEEAGKAIQAAMNLYENTYNEFITDFSGIFVGPVGSKQLDQLLAGQFWESLEDRFERINFETELKRFYDQAEDTWNLPLDGINDDLQEAFKEQFKKELREYDEAVKRATRTYLKVFKEMFIDLPYTKLKDMLEDSEGFDP